MEKADSHYREHFQKERKQGILTNPTFQSIVIGGLVSFIGLLLIWVFTHFENNFTMINQRMDKLETNLNQRMDKLETNLNQRMDKLDNKIDSLRLEIKQDFKELKDELKKRK
jgi:uncharacterized protein YlxW (UPF0749 family)